MTITKASTVGEKSPRKSSPLEGEEPAKFDRRSTAILLKKLAVETWGKKVEKIWEANEIQYQKKVAKICRRCLHLDIVLMCIYTYVYMNIYKQTLIS